jgi:hypothetical protein
MDLHVSDLSSAPPSPAAVAAPETPSAPGTPRAAEPTPKAETAAVRAKKRRRARGRRFDLPAWAVSVLVHVVILSLLGAATFSDEVQTAVASINSALVSTEGKADELMVIDAPPSDAPRDRTVGDPNASEGSSLGGGIGTGPPSATPRVGIASAIGEKTSLPSIQVVPQVSGLSDLPAVASIDLGGGGKLSGDVAYETSDIGVALDQLAREILRHLTQHKLTVVWLFDESGSMKDDQRAIKQKFDRVASELKIHTAAGTGKDKKSYDALNHAIVGFGKGLHYELEKPTFDIDEIGRAIDHLRIDDSGAENTMGAIQEVIGHYASLIRKDRRLLLVLVTDESGDDGGKVEEARQAAVSRGVPIYVIGRQSLFGYERAHLRYIDPVTKDEYWPAVRRGPETADIEMLQWDGLHERWDEQPSGFAPYELARLAKDTGGIYFLLPSEENLRLRNKEKAYSIATLKEYLPEYESRVNYFENRNRSEFRRTLYEIIVTTKAFPFRHHFPIEPEKMIPAATEAGAKATERLNVLLKIQERLEQMRKLRDREPDKRWQAHYDVMLAQIVAYQVKAYEYRACLAEMVQKRPRPSKMPSAQLSIEWHLHHSPEPKAPKEQTSKKYAEALRLLKRVIELHPKTPWADLAQDELNRGLSVRRGEWHHSPKYQERAKLVPKF